MITPKKYVQSLSLMQSLIGNEVVMLDVQSGFYFGLNSVASKIWQMLEVERTVNDIVEQLIDIYDVDYDTCFADTNDLIVAMLEKNIIVEV